MSRLSLNAFGRVGAWLVLFCGLALLSGCSNFGRLAADITETQQRLRVVSGKRPGKFRLAALHDSKFLVAFQDLNRDFAYQPNEPAVWYDLSGSLIKRGDVEDIVLSLNGPSARPLPPALENLFELRGNSLGKIDVQLGKVVSLDDERFSRESASMSMWEPIGFMKAGRAGIFFLDTYDPARTPVLFVHGIGGTGGDFRSMIAQLDLQRFQPWVLNYPSGMDLRRWVTAL